MFESVKMEQRPVYSVCGGDYVQILNSMMEMKFVYVYKLDISKNVDISVQYDVKGGHGADMRNVLILDVVLKMITVYKYMANVGEKVSRQYEVKEWYRILKIRGSKDAIIGPYKIWNRREFHYVPLRNLTLEMNAMSVDKLNVHVIVNRHYDVKMRYRNRTRESSDAIYRRYERWLSRANLYVIYLILELKNLFTELLNVNGVISGQGGTSGRNVSVKNLINE
jgi:hypothetical protein